MDFCLDCQGFLAYAVDSPRSAAEGVVMRGSGAGETLMIATRGDSKSFTLIELLVVIGIIMVLLALLLPVLGRGREKGRQVACKANLKNLHQAIGNKPYEILAIDVGVNDSLKKVQLLQERYQIPYKILFDERGEVSQKYGVIGIPTQVIIDKEGKIL